MARERLVVVGNGMAGLRFLEELVTRAPDRFDVTVIGAEPRPAYNRVLLSALLADEVREEECRFKERPWYLDSGARLITGRPATHIDLEEREVVVGADHLIPYDRLVLAVGSEPIRLSKPGMDLPGVVTFRDLSDVERIRRAAREGARAVVIGGGLLGLEAAYGLARAGVPATLVHLMDRLMERQLDGPAAGLVRAAMEAKGVDILLEADTARVEGEGRAERLVLADGRIVEADLVVVAVGVRPSTALAASSGLGVRRGILVNDGLETSDARVFAVGECIEHRGRTYGLVEPGYEQAVVLARRFAGEDVAYEGSVVATNLKVSGVPVFSAGDILDCAHAEKITLKDPGIGLYKKLVLADDVLTGAVLVGDTSDGAWYLDMIRSRRPVAPIRNDIVFGRALAEGARAAA